MDIKSKKWYDKMFSQVKELLEAMVMQEAAPVGYFVLMIEGQKCTVSWTKDVLTVTAGPYKWAMPIGWFISDSDLAVITTDHVLEPKTAPPEPPTPAPDPPPAVTHGPRIASVPADDDVVGDSYPTLGSDEEDDGPGSDSLLAERPRARPDVPSVAELLNQSPD